MKTSTFAKPLVLLALCAAVSVLAVPTASALDLTDGRLRLTLHEGIGRFSLSYLNRISGGAWVPFLSSQDPRTTMLSIVVGNKVYRMGESAEFSETVEKISGGARFVWKSTFLQVTEQFSFIPAIGASAATGIRIEIVLRNLSEQEISAGVRYLFDTYLGEPGFVHFRTESVTQMSRETVLNASDKPGFWVSPLAGDSEEFGLQVMSSGTGITVPDRIVFANWKRLSDSSWSYEASSARNFSLLPYSVNDSAACQFYDPRSIPRGSEASIVLALGAYAKNGYSGAAASAATSDAASATTGLAASVQQSLSAAKSSSDDATAARADLAAVSRILAAIDASLASGQALRSEDLTLVETALSDIEGRAKRFAPSPGK
jgi:hypothetical protein